MQSLLGLPSGRDVRRAWPYDAIRMPIVSHSGLMYDATEASMASLAC